MRCKEKSIDCGMMDILKTIKMREKALEWWRRMDEQTQREVHSKSIFSKLPFEAFSRSSSKIEMVFKNKDE